MTRGNQRHLTEIKKVWQYGVATLSLEVLFWKTCRERQVTPHMFITRDEHLKLEIMVEFEGARLKGRSEQELYQGAAQRIWTSVTQESTY
jgi:hypothetical protein